jgi:hypothetical protein
LSKIIKENTALKEISFNITQKHKQNNQIKDISCNQNSFILNKYTNNFSKKNLPTKSNFERSGNLKTKKNLCKLILNNHSENTLNDLSSK